MRRHLLAALFLAALGISGSFAATPAGMPVQIGLDLEVGDVSSTSDEAIRLGVNQAVEEINRRGGVLNGRPLEVLVRDNRSVPARGVENMRHFVAMPEVVAVMTGKFSPVALAQTAVLPEMRIPLLDPWAAADGIVDNGQLPNWAFRLSLSDSMVVGAVLRHAKSHGFERIGVLLPNIAWGRSNHEALKRQAPRYKITLSGVEWYNWGGETTLVERYVALRQAGAQAIFLVANEREGAQLVSELAELPSIQRLPVISHWGITGGDFPKLCGEALLKIDLSVVQTYSFAQARNDKARNLGRVALQSFAVDHPDRIPSPVGVAHAYDLTQLLAMAVNQAGSTDRAAVRSALENLAPYDGVLKRYAPAFSSKRHEALREEDLFFSRYQADGRLTRLEKR
jgi:branched-chain amino acid transport system substrate-binding protein